ncbi:MAG: hypothetical protein ABI988_05100 [Nitrospirota bacterium]
MSNMLTARQGWSGGRGSQGSSLTSAIEVIASLALDGIGKNGSRHAHLCVEASVGQDKR